LDIGVAINSFTTSEVLEYVGDESATTTKDGDYIAFNHLDYDWIPQVMEATTLKNGAQVNRYNYI